MQAQQMTEKRDGLRKRLSREEGRQAQREEEFNQLKEQAAERYGTTSPTKLAQIFKETKEKRIDLQMKVEQGYELAELALGYLEQDKPLPGELIKQIDELLANNSDVMEPQNTEVSGNSASGFGAEFEDQDKPDEDSFYVASRERRSQSALERTVNDSRAAAAERPEQARVAEKSSEKTSEDPSGLSLGAFDSVE